MADLPTRVEAWNASVWNYPEAFHQISPELFKGYRLITDNVDFISEPNRDIDLEKKFLGVESDAYGRGRKGRLSFTLLAAAAGQEEYLFQQIAKSPDILRENRMAQILFSAAYCGRTKLVQTLLRKASSPVGCLVKIYYHRPDDQSIIEGEYPKAVPLWLAILVHLIELYIKWRKWENDHLWDVLELLLQDKQVDASRCLFLLDTRGTTSITQFITLKQFIQDANPRNMVPLLGLLGKGSTNPFINGTSLVLSKIFPIFKQTESMGTDETSRYYPFRLIKGDKSSLWLRVAICGDLRVKGGLTVKLF